MVWIIKEFPIVPNIEDSSYYAKRFEKRFLYELVTFENKWINDFINDVGLNTAKDILEFIISEIDYPFSRLGRPCDTHIWNSFDGKACFKIIDDYWQTAYETLLIWKLNAKRGKKGYGDCEDVSIATQALLESINVPSYVCFGQVFKKEQLLGGHAWVIAELEGSWRLCEMTLDVPPLYPSGYPVVDPNSNVYSFGDFRYEAWIKWSSKEYFEWIPSHGVNMSSMFERYVRFDRKDKHSKKKLIRLRKGYREWLKKVHVA